MIRSFTCIYTDKVDIIFLQEFVAEGFDNFPGVRLYTTLVLSDVEQRLSLAAVFL